MASYQVHVGVASVLGAAYGAAGYFGFFANPASTPDAWGPVFLAAGLTTLGGMVPDLDSDSGIPVREMVQLIAVAIPALLVERIKQQGFTAEQTLVVLAGLFLLIRYPFIRFFKQITVHRGMFHSVPMLLISGLTVFLLYEHKNLLLRFYLAGGMMVGVLSHLVLDELYSVNLMGVKLTLNKYAGTALKLWSPSFGASALFYIILAGLGWLTYRDLFPQSGTKFVPRTSQVSGWHQLPTLVPDGNKKLSVP